MKRILSIGIALIIGCFGLLTGRGDARAEAASEYQSVILETAQGIIDWKKKDTGAAADGFLLNDVFLEQAGSTAGDWYPIGLGRLGIADDYDAYLAVIKDTVQQRYQQASRLSAAKATEWHRISLAVLAMGGDPTDMGRDSAGQTIDLIADGTYDRGKTASLGRQGINGWIWGLIALDSMRYEIPDGAFYQRDDIIKEILSQQLSDGGFTLQGDTADPDITAMAVQALAPYYNRETVYVYEQQSSGSEMAKTVRQVVDESIALLSTLQLDTGDFSSWGTQNAESTCQVTVALCALGIDPLTDSRFIKNGNTLLDGILRYRKDSGGFVHSFVYDPENPTADPDEPNTMAGEQVLYTMAALWRQASGLRPLYDFRPERSKALKERIASLNGSLDAVDGSTSQATLEGLLKEFYSLPETERYAVQGYWRLSDTAKSAGVDVSAIEAATQVVESPPDESDDVFGGTFTDSDRAAVDALPEKLTTEQYVTVTKLLDKLEQSEDFEGKEDYLAKLILAKNAIAAVQAEIDAINAEVLDKLYPFDTITLSDKATVDGIVSRYEALSPYDQAKIERWEDVVKTKTKLDNQLRGVVIAVTLCAVAAGIAVVVTLHLRSRRRKKRLAMEALAAQFADEDDE